MRGGSEFWKVPPSELCFHAIIRSSRVDCIHFPLVIAINIMHTWCVISRYSSPYILVLLWNSTLNFYHLNYSRGVISRSVAIQLNLLVARVNSSPTVQRLAKLFRRNEARSSLNCQNWESLLTGFLPSNYIINYYYWLLISIMVIYYYC